MEDRITPKSKWAIEKTLSGRHCIRHATNKNSAGYSQYLLRTNVCEAVISYEAQCPNAAEWDIDIASEI